jgi:hypothetical protein
MTGLVLLAQARASGRGAGGYAPDAYFWHQPPTVWDIIVAVALIVGGYLLLRYLWRHK